LFLHFFPMAFAKSGSWFVFYHLNLRINTFIIPISACIFLIILNLRRFRIYYQTQ
jgi:hypothetical protein